MHGGRADFSCRYLHGPVLSRTLLLPDRLGLLVVYLHIKYSYNRTRLSEGEQQQHTPILLQ
jgi:CobQ-like glutamine amidotransferase family enzyme